MILPRFWRSPDHATIDVLYGTIVAQARLPGFYRAYAVPDTVQGRFDLIVLHLTLVMHRLEASGEAGRQLGQKLFDRFCRDLDDNLREMGVGDLAVPKEMRRFGEAFYGRQAAYIAALRSADGGALVDALRRNIFAVSAENGGPARLAAYVRTSARMLDGLDMPALLRGGMRFPDPEAIADVAT